MNIILENIKCSILNNYIYININLHTYTNFQNLYFKNKLINYIG